MANPQSKTNKPFAKQSSTWLNPTTKYLYHFYNKHTKTTYFPCIYAIKFINLRRKKEKKTNMDNKNNSAQRMPSPFISFLPIALLMGLLYFTISNFGSDSLSGGSQISLLLTSAFCVFLGMAFYRTPWKDFERAIVNNISGVSTALIILLIIGALSGIWMISGVVPTLIYYGIKI